MPPALIRRPLDSPSAPGSAKRITLGEVRICAGSVRAIAMRSGCRRADIGSEVFFLIRGRMAVYDAEGSLLAHLSEGRCSSLQRSAA